MSRVKGAGGVGRNEAIFAMTERGRNWNHFTIEQFSIRVVKPNPNSYKNLTNQTYAKQRVEAFRTGSKYMQ